VVAVSLKKKYAAKQWTEAATAYRALAARSDASWLTWYRLGVSELPEHPDSAARAFRRAATMAPPGVRALAFEGLATADTKRGNADSAFAALDSALGQGDHLRGLAQDSTFAALRSSPRFAQFQHHVDSLARPCAYKPEFRSLDFWLGDWEVTNKAGRHVGTSHEELALDECVLVENWSGLLGSTGRSINTFNQVTHHWEQTWFDDNGGSIEFRDGVARPGEVQFFAKVIEPDGRPGRRRLTFTALPDHRVRQLSEQSTDGGKTWSVEYDFYYQHPTGGNS